MLLDDYVSHLITSSIWRRWSIIYIKSKSDKISFRFHLHLLAERLKEYERVCLSGMNCWAQTDNRRHTQMWTLHEKYAAGFRENLVASAAAHICATKIFNVSQHSDLPMKTANLPLIPVATSDIQCLSRKYMNRPSFSVTFYRENS